MKTDLLKKDILKKAMRKDWTDENGARMGFNQIKKGPLTLRLANVWGFCYGVLYAIEAVDKTLEKYKDQKVYVLGDLIHNPHVNAELQKRGAIFIDPDQIDRVEPDAVVVVPAFGTRKDISRKIADKNWVVVDTTCPEVRTVEDEVRQFSRDGFTAVIHGKWEHQESMATSSYARDHLIIRNKPEADVVCRFIRGDESPETILQRFANAISGGFDPDLHLQKIGMANQTTMLMNESLEVFEMFRLAILARDGHTDNFRAMKTICSATQDRQDAVITLTKNEPIDLFIDVGGHRSSNTRNLAITARQNSRAIVYHIERADQFTKDSITYLPVNQDMLVTTHNWLPKGPVTIGLTAGASTPHSELEWVIQRLLGYYDNPA